MTIAAIASLLTAVCVLVTAGTFAPQPKKSPVRISYFDLRADALRNVPFGVTLLARQQAVFAFQGEAGLPRMVEGISIQLDQCEFFTVMFHMTTRTVCFRRRALVYASMKSGMSIQPMLNFGVTL